MRRVRQCASVSVFTKDSKTLKGIRRYWNIFFYTTPITHTAVMDFDSEDSASDLPILKYWLVTDGTFCLFAQACVQGTVSELLLHSRSVPPFQTDTYCAGKQPCIYILLVENPILCQIHEVSLTFQITSWATVSSSMVKKKFKKMWKMVLISQRAMYSSHQHLDYSSFHLFSLRTLKEKLKKKSHDWPVSLPDKVDDVTCTHGFGFPIEEQFKARLSLSLFSLSLSLKALRWVHIDYLL